MLLRLALALALSALLAGEECVITTYGGPRFEGRRTASGEVYRSNGMTAACSPDLRPLLFGKIVTVAYGNRTVKVRINDVTSRRWRNRIDLSSRSWTTLTHSGPSKCRARWRR
jgi:rare lipoprotein A